MFAACDKKRSSMAAVDLKIEILISNHWPVDCFSLVATFLLS